MTLVQNWLHQNQGGGRAASFLNSQGESVPCFSQALGASLVPLPGFLTHSLDFKGCITTALRPSMYHPSFLLEEAGVSALRAHVRRLGSAGSDRILAAS